MHKNLVGRQLSNALVTLFTVVSVLSIGKSLSAQPAEGVLPLLKF